MSFSSARSWLQNKVNSTFGSVPPPNMSLNSNNTNLGTPIRFSDDGIQIWNPMIKGATDGLIKGISLRDYDSSTPSVSPSTGGHSASEIYHSPVTPAQLEYLNADLAKYYGMSKETAYQEALSNTAYQRSIKDMKAAGLNPAVIYGAGKGSPADGVYSARSASSGGGGYSRRYGSSGKSGNGKLFDSSTYGALAAIGGLVGIAATGRPDGFWIGSQTAQGAMSLMNAVMKR